MGALPSSFKLHTFATHDPASLPHACQPWKAVSRAFGSALCLAVGQTASGTRQVIPFGLIARGSFLMSTQFGAELRFGLDGRTHPCLATEFRLYSFSDAHVQILTR